MSEAHKVDLTLLKGGKLFESKKMKVEVCKRWYFREEL